MNEKRVPIKALHLQVDGSKKENQKKKCKVVLEGDMIASGLHRLDAQDHTRWRLSCKIR